MQIFLAARHRQAHVFATGAHGGHSTLPDGEAQHEGAEDLLTNWSLYDTKRAGVVSGFNRKGKDMKKQFVQQQQQQRHQMTICHTTLNTEITINT